MCPHCCNDCCGVCLARQIRGWIQLVSSQQGNASTTIPYCNVHVAVASVCCCMSPTPQTEYGLLRAGIVIRLRNPCRRESVMTEELRKQRAGGTVTLAVFKVEGHRIAAPEVRGVQPSLYRLLKLMSYLGNVEAVANRLVTLSACW